MRACWLAGKGFAFSIFGAGLLLLAAGCQSGNASNSNGNAPANSSGGSASAASSAVLVYPKSASVAAGGKVQFAAFLPSQPGSTFTWSASGGGSITSAGVFTAPTTPASVTVTATSATGGLTGTATLNITAAQGVLISPAAVAMPAGSTQMFSATVNGSAAAATWQVNGTTGGDGLHGTIDSNGTYIAPLTPPPGGATTITAITGTGASTASSTATIAIIFSNASLNGPYAFSYRGNNSSGFSAVVGSFTAQGSSGQIFAGVDDVLTAGSSASVRNAFSGTFSVNPDGTGSATLSNNMTWEFVLEGNPLGGSARQARLIRFDTNSTGSGTIDAQNAAQLSASAFSGNYAFGLSGIDSGGNALAIAGRFFSDGVGTIPPGSAIEDINDNGKSTFPATTGTTTTTTTTTAGDATVHGTFQMDSTLPSSGRGTLTWSSTNTSVFTGSTTFQFSFYIVDNTHLKVLETDTTAALAGDFYSAANTPNDGAFNSAAAFPNGNYAFTVSGHGSNGAYAAGGILTSGGTSTGTSGQLSGVLDVNNGINDTRLNTALSGSSFTVDTNFGRMTLPIEVNGATANFAGYTAAYNSSTGPVLFILLIELDSKTIAGGMAFPQQSFVAPPQGNYGINLAGASGPKNGAVEQDILGQISTVGTTSLSGNLFFNNFALSTVTPHVPLTGNTAIVSPSANGRGTATLASSVTSITVAYYVVDANSVLLLETDGARVATGVMSKQY